MTILNWNTKKAQNFISEYYDAEGSELGAVYSSWSSAKENA